MRESVRAWTRARPARSRSGGRAAVGAACFATPELTTRVWIGDDAGRTGARLLTPALAASEVILGGAVLGIWAAARRPVPGSLAAEPATPSPSR